MIDGELVSRLANLLESRNRQLVLAESCTGGRVAAELTSVPGISRFFCGSVVTYQDRFKTDWLGIPDPLIRNLTAVSDPITRMMASNVLSRSTTANVSAAVTGHLGPNVDDSVDGHLFVAVAQRMETTLEVVLVECNRFKLTSVSRAERQVEAAGIVLDRLVRLLES